MTDMIAKFADLPEGHNSPRALAMELRGYLKDDRCFQGDAEVIREVTWDFIYKLLLNDGLTHREMEGGVNGGTGCHGILLKCRQLTKPKPKATAPAPTPTPPSASGEWVSVKDAAVLTGAKPGDIYTWHRNALLPAQAVLGKRGMYVEVSAVRKLQALHP